MKSHFKSQLIENNKEKMENDATNGIENIGSPLKVGNKMPE
jgi:hypothetical protein